VPRPTIVVMNRRLPDWTADGVIAVGLFVMSLAALNDYAQAGLLDQYTRQTDALGYLLLAIQTLPLALRRRYPVAVALIVVAGFLLDRGLDYPSTFAGVGTVVAIHAVGSELSSRRSAIVGMSIIGGVTAYTLIGVVVYQSVSLDDAAFVFLTGLAALYLGREVHHRRERSLALEERAERAEREREERARAAVADERARIARELHDVVAHEVAVMTIQAEGALRISPDGDPRVHGALRTIRDAGREALSEMRRMVGLLRDPDAEEGLAPQPGLSELDRLVEQFDRAGLPVAVHVTGTPRRLPGGIDLSAYRIIQESLTNALKHGGPKASADVTVDYQDTSLDITVLDDGRGAAAASNGGHGLVGMHERIALLAGRLEAGPRPGGGFQVHATIPVAAP
jgi:signal transduction histidine kinase